MKNYLLGMCTLLLSSGLYSQTFRIAGQELNRHQIDSLVFEHTVGAMIEEIRSLTRERNYLNFEKYLSDCRRQGTAPEVYAIPRVLYQEDLERIDSLVQYRKAFEEARDQTSKLLRRHPEYQAATDAWEQATEKR
ncbi:MAG: hypothetical protein LUD68_00050 [Rikenellaceae bacterium]|nr:hypothetical protein [Rikenellaceae bacterium]